jgi:hypothetical protein
LHHFWQISTQNRRKNVQTLKYFPKTNCVVGFQSTLFLMK